MIFKIGNDDYSAHVIAGTYEINDLPEYESWRDMNGIQHKFKQRNRLQGGLDMFFRTMEEYSAFKNSVESNKSSSNDSVRITATDNLTNTDKTAYAYIDYSPVRGRDGKWQDYFPSFKVSIEER